MIKITEHSLKRISDRLGIKKKSCQRQAQLALERGKNIRDTKGGFKEYLHKILNRYPDKQLKVFNNHIFVFGYGGTLLITVYKIPKSFKNKELFKEESKNGNK